MGSKLGLILSLFFAVFVFLFATDLICLQANFTNLESIANTVSLMLSREGGANFLKVTMYIKQQNGVSLKMDSNIFQIGEYKEFTVLKDYDSFLIFKDPIQLKVSRTVLVGQFEGNIN